MIFKLPKVILTLRTREWCKLPYPNHPKGCPNYNGRCICPPEASLFGELVSPPYFLIVIKYDLKSHIERMRKKHPDWSDRQLRCCLYWQNTAKKMLRAEIDKCTKVLDFDYQILDGKHMPSPEATGVNVFATANLVGLKLKTYPKDYVYKIAIVGRKVN